MRRWAEGDEKRVTSVCGGEREIEKKSERERESKNEATREGKQRAGERDRASTVFR